MRSDVASLSDERDQHNEMNTWRIPENGNNQCHCSNIHVTTEIVDDSNSVAAIRKETPISDDNVFENTIYAISLFGTNVLILS